MPLDKRKILGPLFGPLARLKHGPLGRIAVATVWLPSQLLRARRNRPYFRVNLGGKRGMGAVLVEALLMCQYAQANGLQPSVTSSNPLYASAQGQDFLALYLGPAVDTAALALRAMEYHTLWSFYHLDFNRNMTLTAAHDLFVRHFAPKVIILDKVNAILALLPQRQFDLSVHYRGTDKALEAPLISFELYCQSMLDYAAGGHHLQQVFLATDDTSFEAFIRSRFPDVLFTTYNLGQSVDASRGRHFSNMRPEEKAVEALVNIFLLAAAPACIRGTSYMSGVSKIVNPALRTITLSRTRAGFNDFPEKEILAEEASRVAAR